RSDHERRPEADPAADLVGEVRAKHVEAGVREIEYAHQREDEREPRGEHEQQQPVADAVQRLDEEKLHRRKETGSGLPLPVVALSLYSLPVRDASSGNWSARRK